MLNNRILSAVAVIFFFGSIGLFADPTLYDYAINVNGTTYCSSSSIVAGCSSYGGFAAVPGISTALFNTTTGQGTLSLGFNPGAAGTYSIGAWIWVDVATPVYNEYGAVNHAAAPGQSWQIDIPDYEVSPNHSGTIVTNTVASTLDNANHIPGTGDDYLVQCSSGSNCNDDTSLAMAFKFTLTSAQQEIITWTLGNSDPGGFSLEQIHPVDGNNASESDLFFSGTAALCTTASCIPQTQPSPEPASWSLTVLTLAGVAWGSRRRLANR